MNKQRLAYLSVCLVASILIIFCLFNLSVRKNDRRNSFVRHFPPHFIQNKKTFDLQHNSYYIAGLTVTHIFLGNYTMPGKIMLINYDLTDIKWIDLCLHSNQIEPNLTMISFIDSPCMYISDRIARSLFIKKFGSDTWSKFSFNINFNAALPVSPASVILRKYDTTLNSTVLTDYFMQTDKMENTFKLEKQGEGFFSTDGMLNYNPDLSCFFYVYYYRNQINVLDSSLKLLYQNKTIDTVSYAKLKVRLVPSEKAYKLAAPAQIVNKYSCTSGNWLYINSGLLADDERKVFFDRNSVIDVYSIKDKRYFYSFYLPDYLGKKINDLKVLNKKVVVINDHMLCTYQINY